jgi:hypothetical protein
MMALIALTGCDHLQSYLCKFTDGLGASPGGKRVILCGSNKAPDLAIGSHSPIQVIRASTDRPELAYYVLNINHAPKGKALWPLTVSLVGHLTELLEPDERILIFFEQREQVDDFSWVAHEKSSTCSCCSKKIKIHSLGSRSFVKCPIRLMVDGQSALPLEA